MRRDLKSNTSIGSTASANSAKSADSPMSRKQAEIWENRLETEALSGRAGVPANRYIPAIPATSVSELSLAGATAAPWRQFDVLPTCARETVALFLPRSVVVPQADGDLNLCGCVSLSPFSTTQPEGSQCPRACDRAEGEGWTLKSRTLVSAVAGFGLMTNIALSNLNLASRLYRENRLRLSRTSNRRRTLLEPPLTNCRRCDDPENALIS